MQAELTRTSLEEYYERGKLAASAIDQGRWIIGDDALEISTSYGGKEVEKYAIQINVPKTRVMEYRTVCGFYEQSARTEYLRKHQGVVVYSHMRAAMRLGDVDAAYRFLDTIAAEMMSVELARIRLTAALGKPVPPVREVFEAQAVRQAGNGMLLLAMREADLVRMAITDHPEAKLTLVVEYIATPPGS